MLPLAEVDKRFRAFPLDAYHRRENAETNARPLSPGRSTAFFRECLTLEQLDPLLISSQRAPGASRCRAVCAELRDPESAENLCPIEARRNHGERTGSAGKRLRRRLRKAGIRRFVLRNFRYADEAHTVLRMPTLSLRIGPFSTNSRAGTVDLRR